MAYGSIVAVQTTYADLTFCLRCAAYIHRHVGDRKENPFFFWLRDLNLEEMRAEIGGDEIEAFLNEMKEVGIRDWFSADETNNLFPLCEGMDQIEINTTHCNKCSGLISELCQEYPQKERKKMTELMNELNDMEKKQFVLMGISKTGEEVTNDHIQLLWELLGNIPLNYAEDGSTLLPIEGIAHSETEECLDEPFFIWPRGTIKWEVWNWFEKHHSKGVRFLRR